PFPRHNYTDLVPVDGGQVAAPVAKLHRLEPSPVGLSGSLRQVRLAEIYAEIAKPVLLRDGRFCSLRLAHLVDGAHRSTLVLQRPGSAAAVSGNLHIILGDVVY